ncbi:MAG: helix-turn-helix domain-containing protein [Candidatus Binataceae bacterium]
MRAASAPKPVLLKPITFAQLSELSRSRLYELINTGEVHAVKIGGTWRIPASELDRFTALAAGRQKA